MFINSTVSSNHKLPLSCKSGIHQLHIRTHGIGLNNCSYVPPTHTQIQSQTHTQSQAHKHRYTQSQTQEHTDTNADTHTNRHTNTQIHTHTDTTTAGDWRGWGQKAVDLKDTRGQILEGWAKSYLQSQEGHRAKGPPGRPGFGH